MLKNCFTSGQIGNVKVNMINLDDISLEKLSIIVKEQEKSITKEMRIASYIECDIGIYDKKGNLIGKKKEEKI